MPRLLVFNPEHDYALAHGGAHYMAPLSVRSLSTRLQLLPLLWSEEKDYILLDSNRIVSAADIAAGSVNEAASEIETVEPWGWDAALIERLRTIGVTLSVLPTREYIDRVRQLSHRRISIEANRKMNSPSLPQEFFSVEEALQFSRDNPGCYFKLPWSSGGRGVVATKELNERQIAEWVSGAIRRQGSVIGEKEVDRTLDFSSLWTVGPNNVEFRGFSISLSDGRGKYGGNLAGCQERILSEIHKYAPSFSTSLIDQQRSFIEDDIMSHYAGPLGIDMMCSRDGEVFPCVEINLRRTMGHAAISFAALPPEKRLELKKLIPMEGVLIWIE